MKLQNYKDLKVFYFAESVKKHFTKKNLTGLLYGNFGAQNMGDEAILSGELSELRKIPNLKSFVVSKNSDEIKRLHKVSSLSLYKPFDILLKTIKSDFVIVGGGGLICKPDRGLMGIVYQLYLIVISILIPKIFGKKIFVLGLGIYKNSNPIILKISIQLLRNVDILTVRDFHSYELLKKHKVKSKIYKDNSYLMEQFDKNEIQENVYFKKLYVDKKFNVGIALINPENKIIENKLISELLKFIKSNDNSTLYWFYSCDYQKGFNNDLVFNRKIIKIIAKTMSRKFDYTIVPGNLNPQIFFSSFKLMDYFISMRLHSSIFAYRNNLAFTGLSYDTKCESFLDSIGKRSIQLNNLKHRIYLNFNKL